MATPAAPARGPSPLEAAQQAIEHARRHLFPFRLDRWLALGFVAFLDQCGRQVGGGFNVPGPGGVADGGEGGGPGLEAGLEWLAAHVLLVSLIAAAVLAVVVGVTALVLWINSRAVFMYIDDAATGRADVARPWREHARHAGSFFAWNFGLTLLTLTAVLVLVLLGVAAVVMLTRAREAEALAAVALLVLLVLALLAVVVSAALASLALRDFVAPLQLTTGLPCGGAIGVFLRLLRAQPGPFVIYLLLKIVYTIVLGAVWLIAGCVTCCCAFLPVVGQTLLQPLLFFERSWSLLLLRQLGHDLLVPPGGGPWAGPSPPDTTLDAPPA